MDIKQEQVKVFETYEQLALKVLESGYRHNPLYLARKAVVDWDLLQSAGIKGKRVLNIGCFEPIDELWWGPLVREWTAVDLSPKSVEIAKTLVRRILAPPIARRIKFRVMDAQELSFKDESFDVVTSFSVLDHVSDPGIRHRAFREMARVVKKNGSVIVTVPNRYSYYRMLYARNVMLGRTTDVGYQYFYSYGELRTELEKVGLSPERFTSDAKNVGDLPKAVRFFLLPLRYLGDRMGFLARKL